MFPGFFRNYPWISIKTRSTCKRLGPRSLNHLTRRGLVGLHGFEGFWARGLRRCRLCWSACPEIRAGAGGEEAAKRYDRVILDTPAALGLPDSKTVSELCDGLVMVVRADVTSNRDLQATLEIMDRSRLLGLVINGAQIDQSRYGYMS